MELYSNVFQWWLTIFIIGVIFLPFTSALFKNFFDRGYLFSKVLGMIIISYVVFVLGFLHIAVFNQLTIVLVILVSLALNLFLFRRGVLKIIISKWAIFLFEETIFFIGILFWAFIKSHGPDIHGLEKFMDFGFINSILRSEYFPPKDMWFTPFPINYYYFGHIMTAVLTKISFIPSNITYNLMLATIFSFTFSCSFSIGANLIHKLNAKRYVLFAGGLLTAFLVSLSGNLHTIYAFFQNYPNESPVPIWRLAFSPLTFPNNYWYPNATRFIYNTIHEFPAYSFVVSDLHGHVLDIPIVLLTIALLLSLIPKSKITNSKQYQNSNTQNLKIFGFLNLENFNLFRISNFEFRILLLGFLLATMYMTNVWDGLIYFLLAGTVFMVIKFSLSSSEKLSYFDIVKYLIILVIGFFVFSLPFNLGFKPFASGIGFLCSPEFLIAKGNIGPFLFEASHCQKSPWWQLLTLHGFFYFFIFSFGIFLIKKIKVENSLITVKNIFSTDLFVLSLIIVSSALVIIPEFFYVKDIYPAHYRANTMFKLTYQEFIMLSIASGYVITRFVLRIKYYVLSINLGKKLFAICYLLFATSFLILVFTYPFSAVGSYYNNLTTNYGLNGTKYLENLYPSDHQAISWINKNIKGNPVILEAQGDSYTDYARISSNTGLPTVLGWTVHEWLWRGTYDIPSPRIAEVQTLYEGSDITKASRLIKKYRISYVYIGVLESQKYTKLSEDNFRKLGKIVYKNKETKIYKIN